MFRRMVWLFMAGLAGVFYGCSVGDKEKVQLQAIADSLVRELKGTQEAVATMQEVTALIDSVDASRFVLRTDIADSTSLEEYVARMKEIDDYMKDVQKRIAFLECKERMFRGSASLYAGSIQKLRVELKARNQELARLRQEMVRFANLRDNLINIVGMQLLEIDAKDEQMAIDASRIDTLEGKMNELEVAAKMDEAESYFIRAQAIEELANRTRFAPRKKKNTWMEALELYRKASLYGKVEALAKISELEKKI